MLPVVVAALVATTTGSCNNGNQAPTVDVESRLSQDSSVGGPTPDVESGTLPAEYVGPPIKRPVLVVNNQSAEPSMYIWRVGTAVKRLVPESDDAVRRNKITLGSNMKLNLRTSGVLGRMRALYYGPTEKGDPPEVEDAQTFECGPTESCRVTAAASGYEVTFKQPLEPGGVLVVQIDYPAFSDADKRLGLDLYSIAWAMDLEP